MPKLITVFGASAVITTALGHPVLSKEFRIRAITRDPSKPSGQALAKQGVGSCQGINPSFLEQFLAADGTDTG
ncbi:hypothetical protein FN846DRAFT_936004 [Sphaerosporella brunnea]|uniref:NmrA-like domain-containing protein n=1 Tax=Sphaerosporella brunnea TaxID=1250544 RepID=A0A5J5F4L7_9PEZI|nr:hypothetical protein FN846DRAFT_936004 [Sphaerosporella brunnea]